MASSKRRTVSPPGSDEASSRKCDLRVNWTSRARTTSSNKADRAFPSGQEFDAVGLAAAPDDFARLVLWTIGDQRQAEPVHDIDRDIGHDPGAARRDVEHEACFVTPSSTVIQAGCLCSCRRGSRATFALVSTVMTIIHRWIKQATSLWGIP
jgi:hypothetical protein